MIQGNYAPYTGMQPSCFDIAYDLAMGEIRKGTFVGIHHMIWEVMESDRLMWKDKNLIESGIRTAMQDGGLL